MHTARETWQAPKRSPKTPPTTLSNPCTPQPSPLAGSKPQSSSSSSGGGGYQLDSQRSIPKEGALDALVSLLQTHKQLRPRGGRPAPLLVVVLEEMDRLLARGPDEVYKLFMLPHTPGGRREAKLWLEQHHSGRGGSPQYTFALCIKAPISRPTIRLCRSCSPTCPPPPLCAPCRHQHGPAGHCQLAGPDRAHAAGAQVPGGLPRLHLLPGLQQEPGGQEGGGKLFGEGRREGKERGRIL
jgi:hypothetical protein